MKKNITLPASEFKNSSFLSCEKDSELILRKLFIESRPYSDFLKRLLIINTKDCLDNLNSEVYNKHIKEINIHDLCDKGYIKFAPKVAMPEHEDVKSYIIISYDNFSRTSNTSFRDCTISFDILCHTDYWDLGGFRMRPLKIAGYIDGILNGTKLSGIGTLEFSSCKELILDESLSGYSLIYRAVHGSDDNLKGKN